MKRVRIGMIGAGGVAQSRHLPYLKEVAEADVRIIWSRDPVTATKVAREFEIPETADSWQAITESNDLDAVIIATPPVLHQQVTLKALSSGKHVLSQARMARNLHEAISMLKASEYYSDLVTCLYPPLPGLKGDNVMKQMLKEQNYVGEILEVRVTGMSLIEPSDTYMWQSDPDITGVNTMTMGMWAEVLNRWVGPAKRVFATGCSHTDKRVNISNKLENSTVPDSLAIVADLECGATASYHFSTGTPCGPGSSIEIYGSRGTLIYTLFKEEIMGASEGQNKLDIIPIPPDMERKQTTDSEFVKAIINGTHVYPDFREGIKYMEFSEAVAISLNAGSAVSLPPSPTMDAWGSSLKLQD